MARFFIICLLVIGFLVLTTQPDSNERDPTKPLIVATTSIIGDWLHKLGGDDFDIAVLMKPDQDPHHFDPAPRQAAQCEKAAQVFAIGLNYESWLKELISSNQQTHLSEGLSLIHLHDHENHEGHDHGDFDPHVWLDPQLTRQIIVRIKDILTELRPDKSAAISARAKSYDNELKQLDSWCESTLATIPQNKRRLVTSHRSLAYLARRYQLEVDEDALTILSSGHGDPSIRKIDVLIDHIVDLGIPTLFGERHHDNRLIRQVAEQSKTILETDLATDALTPLPHEASTYMGMIRHNVSLIARGLTP